MAEYRRAVYISQSAPGKDAPLNETSPGAPAGDATTGPELGSTRRAARFRLPQFWLPTAISLFAALLVLLIGGTVLLQLANEQAAILDEARKHTSNLARAFEEHIRRTVKEIDQTLLVLKRGYESDPARFALWEWPGKELLLQDLPVQIALVDRDGRIKGTTEGPAPVAASVRNEDYFRYLSRPGRRAVPASRPPAAAVLVDAAGPPAQRAGRQFRRGAMSLTRPLPGPFPLRPSISAPAACGRSRRHRARAWRSANPRRGRQKPQVDR